MTPPFTRACNLAHAGALTPAQLWNWLVAHHVWEHNILEAWPQIIGWCFGA